MAVPEFLLSSLFASNHLSREEAFFSVSSMNSRVGRLWTDDRIMSMIMIPMQLRDLLLQLKLFLPAHCSVKMVSS